MLDTFVSSDGQSIPAGTKWIETIDDALRDSVAQISLCSPFSISRPWINFEAGASWIRDIPVIPLCHSGLKKCNLPIPLALLQSADIDDPQDLEKLFSRLTAVLGSDQPPVNYQEFIVEYKSFEYTYTRLSQALGAVKNIERHLEGVRTFFYSRKCRNCTCVIEDWKAPMVLPSLELLAKGGFISFSTIAAMVSNLGNNHTYNIVLTEKYFSELLPIVLKH